MRDKIVTVTLGDDLYVRAPHVFQYDYGLMLVIEGIQLPEDYEVHFSNKKRGVAKKGEVTAEGAKIPDEYLRSGENVYAWVYLRNGDDDGYTVYSIEIPVVPRSVEQGDNIDVIEHNIIDKTIEALNEAVAQSEENVSHYPYIDEETHHWMVYDAEQEQFVDTGVDAEGEIADIIDDTAGISEHGKTWSANKLVNSFAEAGSRIRKYTINVDANITNEIIYTNGSLGFVKNEFTDNSVVIGYLSANDKYYISLNYTINPKSLTYFLSILPGAPSGTIDLFITEIA